MDRAKIDDAYQNAVIDELEANDGLLNEENALDFSTEGIASKLHPDCLPALMQQALLLYTAGEDPEALYLLDETLEKIDALDEVKKPRDPLGNWDRVIASVIMIELCSSLDERIQRQA